MDAEWVAVVVSIAVALVGFAGSLVNALWARRERLAAGKSADLALEVQESMAASQASIAASLARPEVAFEVVQDGRAWVLRNCGQGAATNVAPAWPRWVRLLDEDGGSPATMEPGTGISFVITNLRFGEKRSPTMGIICDQLPQAVNVSMPTRRD